MSSTQLIEVENRMNEVRQRLENLSLTFQHEGETTRDTTGAAETQAKMLAERNINDCFDLKSDSFLPKGSLNRLVGLSRRETAQRDNCHQPREPSAQKENMTTLLISSEVASNDVSFQEQTHCEPTISVQKSHYACATKTAAPSFCQHAQPTHTAVFCSPTSNKVTSSHHDGCDLFQVLQARLREKLQKSAVKRSPSSSPDKMKTPSPKAQTMWKPDGSGGFADNSANDAVRNGSRSTVRTELGKSEQRPAEGRSPSVSGAANTMYHAKTLFPVSDSSKKRLPLYSSSTGKQQRPHCAAFPDKHARPSASRSFSRCNTGSARCSPSQTSVQRPRRSSSGELRPSSPCRAAQPALPLKTAPQRTVLDVLTGAELFALMRLRGVVVSRGETGESALPDTRCHSVYLSPDEHKQLLELRANLRLRSMSARPTEARAQTARGSLGTKSLNRGKQSR